MKTVINLFHPDYQHSRVNRALAAAAKEAGFEIRNLYELYPDFKIDVEQEKRVFERADRMVWQFPFRWYAAPALLNKYENDVLEYGWAYGQKGTVLHGKELLISTTVGANNYGHHDFVKYDVNELLRPFQATSRLIGTRYLPPFKVMGASSIDDDQLRQAAADYVAYLKDRHESLGDYE